MDSLLIVKPGEIEISSITEKDLKLKEGEVLVEVSLVSLCGSDYKLFDGTYSGPSVYPICFGHEWSGTVIDSGPRVNSVKKGDRVTGDCSCWCGQCPNCTEDKNLCYNIEKYGITKHGFSQQLVVVPEKYLYLAPVSMPYEVLALSECFAVALHAIRRLGNNPQERSSHRTLILGCGPLGIAIYMLLRKLYRWRYLEIYDILPEKIAYLKKIFPEDNIGHSINESKTTETNSGYRDLYTLGDYSLVFEAVGRPEALQMAINLTKPRGTIVSLGMFPAGIVDFKKVVMKSISILGSIGGTGEFPAVIKFFEENISAVSSIVTGKFFYKYAKEAFSIGQNRKEHLKVQIQFVNKER